MVNAKRTLRPGAEVFPSAASKAHPANATKPTLSHGGTRSMCGTTTSVVAMASHVMRTPVGCHSRVSASSRATIGVPAIRACPTAVCLIAVRTIGTGQTGVGRAPNPPTLGAPLSGTPKLGILELRWRSTEPRPQCDSFLCGMAFEFMPVVHALAPHFGPPGLESGLHCGLRPRWGRWLRRTPV